jgi:hypothetical protein
MRFLAQMIKGSNALRELTPGNRNYSMRELSTACAKNQITIP